MSPCAAYKEELCHEGTPSLISDSFGDPNILCSLERDKEFIFAAVYGF
jgi:hypothetical protein